MNLARHYRTLGLRPGSSGRELKAAYRQLVRRYHPDLNPDKQAVERFIKINDAYTAISEVTLARARRDLRNNSRNVQANATPQSKPKRPSQKAPSPHPAQPKYHEEQSVAAKQSRKEKPVPGSATTKATIEPLNLKNIDVDNLKLQLEKLGIGKFSPSQATEAGKEAKIATRSKPSASKPLASKPSVDEQEAKLKQEAYLQLKALLQQQKYPRAIALVEGLAHRMSSDAEISQWQAIVYQRWGRMLIGQGHVQKARIYLKKALRTDPNNPSLWSEVNRDFWQLANLDNTIDQPAKSTR